MRPPRSMHGFPCVVFQGLLHDVVEARPIVRERPRGLINSGDGFDPVARILNSISFLSPASANLALAGAPTPASHFTERTHAAKDPEEDGLLRRMRFLKNRLSHTSP